MLCFNQKMDKYENRRALLQALVNDLGRGGIAQIAKSISKEPNYVSRMLYPPDKNGAKRIGEDTLEELQKAYPRYFFESKDVASASSVLTSPVAPPTYDEPPEGYARLPVMAEAAAGPGRAAMQEVVQHVDVLESYIRQRLRTNPANVKVLTARGTSMSGLIEDGDVMFVQPTNEFTDDGVYILTLDDLVRVKRLSVSITTGKVVIESNDGRAPEELPLKEVPHRLHIQGRVIGSWSLKSFS